MPASTSQTASIYLHGRLPQALSPSRASASAQASAQACASPASDLRLKPVYEIPELNESQLQTALQELCRSHDQLLKAQGANSKGKKSQNSGSVLKGKSPLEAAGGNAAIAAILERYQKRAQISCDQSLFADYSSVLSTLTSEPQADLLTQFFGSNSALNHTIYLCTALSHVLGLALNHHEIQCRPQPLDDKLFLNTGELGAKLPLWTLTFNLSACPECAPITGITVSRLTFKPLRTTGATPKTATSADCISSTHTADPMFCEALGVSISQNGGPFKPLPQALLLDAESCFSDMLEGAFNYQENYQEEEDDAADAADATAAAANAAAEDAILSPALLQQQELKPLLNALKYVLYFLTHQDEVHSGSLEKPHKDTPELKNPNQVLSVAKLYERTVLEQHLQKSLQQYVL